MMHAIMKIRLVTKASREAANAMLLDPEPSRAEFSGSGLAADRDGTGVLGSGSADASALQHRKHHISEI